MILSIKNQLKVYKTETDLKELLDEIKDNKKILKGIDFSGNKFYPEALEILFNELEDANLEHIHLSKIFTALPPEEMIKGLEIILRNLNPQIVKSFNMSENALGGLLTDKLFLFIEKTENLERIQLNDCGLGKIGIEKLAAALISMENKCLEYLDISQNRLTTGAEKLGEALQHFACLETFKIQYNSVDRETMEKLLSSIKNLTMLKTLDLRDNVISDKGCKLLGEILAESNINDLIIGDCLVTNEGIEIFINEALKKEEERVLGGFNSEKTKFRLDISYNDIDQHGLNLLTEYAKSGHLEYLNITGNDFEDCQNLVGFMKEQKAVIIFEEEDEAPKVVGDELIEKVEKMMK
ncbi:hypothetical protein SLOPH_1846 [Spraguea lophii 42_110]|uniref:Ran GTPase-activating protein n=1 Tax=Spraguea lophii (strain 42_110) TaxID=1358809 RepID=S7W8R8_SPRLO|nr:hypothetical protein SLOPH_1846 [Spraguea lophii 42_110]